MTFTFGGKSLNLVGVIVRHDPARFAKSIALMVAASFAEGLSLLLIVPILGKLEGQAGGTLTLIIPMVGAVHLSLLAILAILIILVVAQAAFARTKNVYLADHLFGLLNAVRLDLFAAIGRMRWEELARQKRSDLHHLLTTDVERIYSAAFSAMVLIQTVILLGIYLAVSAFLSIGMTVFAFAVGLTIFAVLAPLRRRAYRFGVERTANKRVQYHTVGEFLGGLKTAKIFNAEDTYETKLAENLALVRGEAVGYMRLTSLATIASQAISAVAVASLVFVGTIWLDLSLPTLIAFLFILMRIAPRFLALQAGVQDVATNLPVLETVRAFKASAEMLCEPQDNAEALAPLELHKGIRLNRLTYRYVAGDGAAALDDVTLFVPAFAMTALIGPSGGGKSTLADILSGLSVAQTGSVVVDACPLDLRSARGWRNRVAYVPQDPFLLRGDVASNLRLGAPRADGASMWQALEDAGAADFVRDLGGLDAKMGENGATLSGGQRQRLALARALVASPQLLILDEATSALDWASQERIIHALRELRGRTTIVVIAHRASMVAIADHVAAFDGGRLVESGTLENLLHADGPVARMMQADVATSTRELRRVALT